MQNLTIWDLLLTPVFLLILSYIARKQRDKRYPIGHPLRPYFMKALNLKFAGAIFIGLLYQYYYRGGDTYNFFYHTRIINSSLKEGFSIWFKLISHQPIDKNPDIYDYARQMYWYHDNASYTVAAIGAAIGVFCATSYMPIAVTFAYFSFTGIWAMYRIFSNIYPQLYHQLAIAFLFIPTTIVWGSGIFKDTVCMFGLGWLTYTAFRVFINRDLSAKNLLLLSLSCYLVALIKIYIVIAFMPALIIWLLSTYSSSIYSASLRWITKLGLAGLAVICFFFLYKVFADEMERYSLEEIAQTANTTRGWISYASDKSDGSTYDLGKFEPTIQGMLSKFPQAVTVTLFRPFPWETRKAIVLFSALEALTFIFFTLKAFAKRGIIKTLQLIGKDPNLLFFLVFSLIFAFAVGISSYNFGALSRYKIPCMPFYSAFVVVVLYYHQLQQPLTLPQLNKFKKRGRFARTLY